MTKIMHKNDYSVKMRVTFILYEEKDGLSCWNMTAKVSE